MKKILNERILIFGIILFTLFLRFWGLGQNPPSLNWDEVSIGYNAYSVLKTGKDEFGNFLPLYFRSLDDYKQPVYPYLTVASEYIFGLTPFAVRFPSALLGSITVLLIYLLTRELLANKNIALLSAFFLSISPWHIQFSRVAIEANVGLFFITLAIFVFLFSIRKNISLLPMSSILLMFSMYSYLAFRIVVPLIALFLYAFHWREIAKKNIFFVFAIIIIGFSIIFLFQDTFFQNGMVRIRGNNVFDHYPQVYEQTKSEMDYDAKLKINLIRKAFHDTSIPTSLDLMTRGYLSHFSADFLFFYLNQKHHHAPGVGLIYILLLPFMPLGFYFLFRGNKKVLFILVFWLLIAPLPASVTWDIPHAIRSINMLIPLEIIAAVGVWSFFRFLFKKNTFSSHAVLVSFIFLVTFSITYFLHQYFIHLPHERSKEWVYGREELVKYLETHKKEYKKIIISTKLEWPYIFILFYSAYDPKKYLTSGGTISGGWGEEKNSFDIYEFHEFNYDKDEIKGDTLYVGEPGGFSSKISPLKVIYYLNGKPAIYLVKKKA